MNYLLVLTIVGIGLLTTGISFGQISSINCDGDTITYNISKIIIYSCERLYTGGTVYTAPQNSVFLKTNGEGGNLELNIPKSLMDEIYDVYNSKDRGIKLLLQKSNEMDSNIISIEIPDKVNLITIDGSDPRYEFTTTGLIISVILIGGGIGVMVLLIKKWKLDDLRK